MRVSRLRFISRLRVPQIVAWLNKSHVAVPTARKRKYGTPSDPTFRTPPKTDPEIASGSSGRMMIQYFPRLVRL